MLEVIEMKIEELLLNERNPRRMRPERRAQFLKTLAAERGLTEARPVIARRSNKEVIAGNMRLQGARELGWKTIPTVLVDVDDLRAATWTFLDNRQFGEDDEDLAAELLAELQERGGDLELTGFDRAATDALLRRLLHREKNPDLVLPLPEEEPDSVLGTIYEMGPHRLMCGDATNPAHVRDLLGNATPLLLATDPPYGIGLDNRWRDRAGLNTRSGSSSGRARGRPLDGHASTSIASDDRCDWSEAYELVPSLTVAYVWVASARACEVEAGLERIGFQVRQQLIWDKGLFALSRQHYHWAHEPCLYATRTGARVPWYGPRNQSTVWRAASPKMVMAAAGGPADTKLDHATQKPVVLFSTPITNHLSVGEIVYDPFAGSGTSVIAAELTGRVCYAMELDPRCCDLVRERWEVFTSGR
ncbi:MAG TPA: DNA methyltransferase [Gaiellaceae bacterium]|jgi:DNA modification methylase